MASSKDDEGTVTTELEGVGFEVSGAEGGDELADAGAACEGDFLDEGMETECFGDGGGVQGTRAAATPMGCLMVMPSPAGHGGDDRGAGGAFRLSDEPPGEASCIVDLALGLGQRLSRLIDQHLGQEPLGSFS